MSQLIAVPWRTYGRRLLLVPLLLCLTVPVQMRAQVVGGTILGRIADQSGRIVPQAQILMLRLQVHAVKQVLESWVRAQRIVGWVCFDRAESRCHGTVLISLPQPRECLVLISERRIARGDTTGRFTGEGYYRIQPELDRDLLSDIDSKWSSISTVFSNCLIPAAKIADARLNHRGSR
jgi:hypothetical protein